VSVEVSNSYICFAVGKTVKQNKQNKPSKMPKISCRFPECDKYCMQQNTFCEHIVSHLTMGEVDYVLGELFEDFNPHKLKCNCETKNNFKTRPDLLAHLCKRHFDEEQLEYIEAAFVPKPKGQKMSSKDDIEQVRRKVEKSKRDSKDMMKAIRKPLPSKKPAKSILKKKVEIVESEDEEEDDSQYIEDEDEEYDSDDAKSTTSARSDHTQADKGPTFNPKSIKSVVTNSKPIMAKLLEQYHKATEKHGEYFMDPTAYYEMYPKDSATDYIEHIKAMILHVQEMLEGINDLEIEDVPKEKEKKSKKAVAVHPEENLKKCSEEELVKEKAKAPKKKKESKSKAEGTRSRSSSDSSKASK
jgi:hypothetical protein